MNKQEKIQKSGLIKIIDDKYKLPYEIVCNFCGQKMQYDINLKIYEHKIRGDCFKFVEARDYIYRTKFENEQS